MGYYILSQKMQLIANTVDISQEVRGLLVEKPFHKWKDAIYEFQVHFRGVQKDKTKGC